MMRGMLGIHDLWLFVVSGLLLNIAPGPDSLLVMTRSAAHGGRAGSAAALGVGAGVFVHVAAAALGLSALLATSATAFTIVKIVGAAYLVWLGIGMLWPRRPRGAVAREGDVVVDAPAPAADAAPSARRLFLQGFATNVLNPKVALFFLAFVPQFISPESPSKALAFLVLGLVFDVNGVLWLHVLIAFTVFARRRVRVAGRAVAWLNRGLGALFVALGVKLALGTR
jgi:threonine/homoserine/homoserine lactone efflux protein